MIVLLFFVAAASLPHAFSESLPASEASTLIRAGDYTVKVTRLSTETPLTAGTLLQVPSDYTFVYNPAIFKSEAGDYTLACRCQNKTSSGVTSSVIVGSTLNIQPKSISAQPAVTEGMLLNSTEPYEKCGTEDPRIVQSNGVTYMYYTAYDCSVRRKHHGLPFLFCS